MQEINPSLEGATAYQQVLNEFQTNPSMNLYSTKASRAVVIRTVKYGTMRKQRNGNLSNMLIYRGSDYLK